MADSQFINCLLAEQRIIPFHVTQTKYNESLLIHYVLEPPSSKGIVQVTRIDPVGCYVTQYISIDY